ncbi:MAG TPA: alpha/beta hydrolase family protein [Lunatimonas sp.]|nr:alpha/beta hydrolase family protein [Lunatimonas sp.]
MKPKQSPVCAWKFSAIGTFFILFSAIFSPNHGQTPGQFPFSADTLEKQFDLPNEMMKGISDFLDLELQKADQQREDFQQIDFSNPSAFNISIAPKREALSKILGLEGPRSDPEMEIIGDGHLGQFSVEQANLVISAVRWKVLDGDFKDFYAEGLLLQPRKEVRARMVFIPDADDLPEISAGLLERENASFGSARQLAESGIEVLIPVLVSREDTFSGSQILNKFTNQPHREWIYRQGFILGRHIIGYELQKVFAAIDWFEAMNRQEGKALKIGVAGHGEGGLLSLYASALDTRISSTLVSGYFNERSHIWKEPIYRNVFGLLKEFGDAELAAMSWPRRLIIDYSLYPEVSGPPEPSDGRNGAAPGKLTVPEVSGVKSEWDRAEKLLPQGKSHLSWHEGKNSLSKNALKELVKELGTTFSEDLGDKSIGEVPASWPEADKRQQRTVKDMEFHMQQLISKSEQIRDKYFWETVNGDAKVVVSAKDEHRERLWQLLGRLPDPDLPVNPMARKYTESEKWTGYEVKLDVWPGIYAWGILLIPKNRRSGEQYPAVVCQHGLEGLPQDVVTRDEDSKAFAPYQGFAAELADRGYVVFAPHNLYWGGDDFRVLQRKANPLGLSLFSVITGQHQRIVEWLGQQSFVDAQRIGFYGLSYGGKAAMRVPALVEGYALSICSGDFNEWVRKVSSTDHAAYNSYPFTGEYEIPEWNLANTYNYAEMAALIAPRPFMVERGHRDGVGTDKWVAYEYAKVRLHYTIIGKSEATEIEYFDKGHTINGEGSFKFLDRYLKNP